MHLLCSTDGRGEKRKEEEEREEEEGEEEEGAEDAFVNAVPSRPPLLPRKAPCREGQQLGILPVVGHCTT